ncbi:MAG: hypothetical protein WCE54_08635 [Ignavibacteriaceae bacterium]
MNLLELIGIIFIVALIFNIFIAIFAIKGAGRTKNVDLFEKEM